MKRKKIAIQLGDIGLLLVPPANVLKCRCLYVWCESMSPPLQQKQQPSLSPPKPIHTEVLTSHRILIFNSFLCFIFHKVFHISNPSVSQIRVHAMSKTPKNTTQKFVQPEGSAYPETNELGQFSKCLVYAM